MKDKDNSNNRIVKKQKVVQLKSAIKRDIQWGLMANKKVAMKKVIPYISYAAYVFILFLIIFGISYFDLSFDWVLLLFIAYITVATIHLSSKMDYAKSSKILYQEKRRNFFYNFFVSILIIAGGFMFIFIMPQFLNSYIFSFFIKIFGAFGLVLSIVILVGKDEIILMEKGFICADPATALRNKYILYYRKFIVSYSSLEGYSLINGAISLYSKGNYLPKVGYTNIIWNFKSDNSKKIIEILKLKGVKELNKKY